MITVDNISQTKVAGGWLKQYRFNSHTLNSQTQFAIFLPATASKEAPLPVLYWLSGLTCTDENFMQKAGAFQVASELGIVIVAPDTSPRGEGVPDDSEGAYDLGLGAGFYVNATQAPWSTHYHMYDFIRDELPAIIESHFPVSKVRAISGHSMGGHGAIMLALRNPNRYSSVSAFSPICNPMAVPWGQKAFSHYLGSEQADWSAYDCCELMGQFSGEACPLLVDQGDRDDFLSSQLKPDRLMAAAELSDYPLNMRIQPGYDHSYFFISTFIQDHLRFHASHFKY